MAMDSPRQLGFFSSCRSTWGALTLANTRCSKSRPASNPQNSWVGRA